MSADRKKHSMNEVFQIRFFSMKTFNSGLFLPFFLAFYLYAPLPALCETSAAAKNSSEAVVDSVVASVNGKPLTFLELAGRLKSKRRLSLKEASSDPEFRQLMETAILDQIVQDEAQNRKMDVSQDEIERYTDELAQRNNLSRDGFLKALQDEGNKIEDFNRKVRIEILKSKLGAAVVQGGVAISQSEIEEYIKHNPGVKNSGVSIKLRQIFISSANKSPSDAKLKIDQIYEKLKDGDDFEDLAKEYSEGSEASEGGLLGEVTESELNPAIFHAVSTLTQDQFSNIVESEDGFRIFFVEDRTQQESQDSGNQEQQLEARRYLENQKLQEKMMNYFSVDILKNHSIDKKI